MNKLLFFLPLLILSSCIGTDLVDEPLGEDMSSLTLNESTTALVVGGTTQLEASYLDFSGQVAQPVLVWASENPDIATVNDAGLVAGISPGQTTVSVSAETLVAEVLVTVVADDTSVAQVIIEGATTSLDSGQMVQLNAVLKNVLGETLPGTFSIDWESSDPNVVSVDNSGLATANNPGSANIIARYQTIQSSPFSIQVSGGSRQGTFQGLNGYSVSGSVEVSETEIIFGSDFSSSSGPGLFVYMSNSMSSVGGGIEIGPLGSTTGIQSYDLPNGVGQNDYNFIIIHCKPFGIPFGTAPLD